MPLPKPRTIKLRSGQAVDLYQADFNALRRIADGGFEIKHYEREFRRLKARGLATHRFENDAAGFPRALATLTAAGAEALTMEFA